LQIQIEIASQKPSPLHSKTCFLKESKIGDAMGELAADL
jgi:hypothetical protein